MQNVSILSVLRRMYFKDKPLDPILLATRLTHISDENRLPAVRAVLELVSEQQRDVLKHCIREQESVPWDIRLDQSGWHIFNGLPYGWGQADVENLTSLEYWRLFEVASSPEDLDQGRFVSGIEDYLVNDFAILEALRLAGEAEHGRQQRLAAPADPGPYRMVLSYDDLRMHLHLCAAVVRLRAGWDKIANNVLRPWFDPLQKHGWPDSWQKRVNALGRVVRARNAALLPFWEDFRQNAQEVSAQNGLRNIRDRDLHYWSPRTLETFGSQPGEWTLAEMSDFVLHELERLTDAWLLTMAMICSDA